MSHGSLKTYGLTERGPVMWYSNVNDLIMRGSHSMSSDCYLMLDTAHAT
jgi:hypothetical protein